MKEETPPILTSDKPETPPTPQASIMPELVSPKPPILIMVIILALILSLIGTAFFAFQNMQLSKEIASLKATPTPIAYVSPNPVATTDLTANWDTYTNNTYNFSLQHPSSWIVDVSQSDLQENAKLVLSNGTYKITFWSNLVGIGGGTKNVPSEKITISGTSLYERDLGENLVDKTGSFEIAASTSSPTFIYKNKTYDISFQYPFADKSTSVYASNLAIFNQILSTFKFTQ